MSRTIENYDERQKLIKEIKNITATIKETDGIVIQTIACLNVGIISEATAVRLISVIIATGL